MTAVGLLGGGLAFLRSTADPLSLASLSRLGIDAGAAVIMNATLIGLGLALAALGLSLRRAFAELPDRTTRSWHDLTPAGFVGAGVGVAVTGVFSVEVPASTVVHNLAGFSAPLLIVGSLVAARVSLGDLGSGLDAFSVMVVGVSGTLFISASTLGLPSYPMMELVCFTLIGAWLWLFEASLGRAMRSGTVGRTGRLEPARYSVGSMSSGVAPRPPLSGPA